LSVTGVAEATLISTANIAHVSGLRGVKLV
jgi:hypothetical protein